MVDAEQILADPRILIELLKEQPQTYQTILGDAYRWNSTMQFKVRRKLNIMTKDGMIMKMTVPGTRFGMLVFYNEPRKYTLLVEATRFGAQLYYFFDMVRLSNNYFKVKDIWKFDSGEWKKESEEKTFFNGYILKMF